MTSWQRDFNVVLGVELYIAIHRDIIGFTLFTDLSQYHSKLCGPLVLYHQLQIQFTNITIIWPALKSSEKTPSKIWKNLTLPVKERFILQHLVPSSLCFLQLYISSRAGPLLIKQYRQIGITLYLSEMPCQTLISPLLSQALHRPVSLLFSGLSAKLTTLQTYSSDCLISLNCSTSTCHQNLAPSL